MKALLAVLVSLPFVTADFECVCAYDVETPVYGQASTSSIVLGYMYEFDCKPLSDGASTASDFIAVQFEMKKVYVHTVGDVRKETCPNDPSLADLVPTMPTQRSPDLTSTKSAISSSPPFSGITVLNVTTSTSRFTLTSSPNSGVSQSVAHTSTTAVTMKQSSFKTATTVTKSLPLSTSSVGSLVAIRTSGTPLVSSAATYTIPNTPGSTTGGTRSTLLLTSTTRQATSRGRTTTLTTTPAPATTASTPPIAATMTSTQSASINNKTFNRNVNYRYPDFIYSSFDYTTYGAPCRTASGRVDMCPNKYGRDLGYFRRYGDRCYELRPSDDDWISAEADCAASGGTLVVIKDAATQSSVLTMLSALRYRHPVWIGLHDMRNEGVWEWTDGSVFNQGPVVQNPVSLTDC